MNPSDHTGRIDSPFIERAEAADIVTDVHVMPDRPVTAASVLRDAPSVLPQRHARRSGAVWTGAAFGSFFGAALVVLFLTVGGFL